MSNVNWAGLSWLAVFLWAAGGTAVCVWLFLGYLRQVCSQRILEAEIARAWQNYRLAYITEYMDELERYRQCPELPEAERQELETAYLQALHTVLFHDVSRTLD